LDDVDCIFFVCLQAVNNKQEAVSIRKTNFSFIFFESDGATNIISLAYIFDTKKCATHYWIGAALKAYTNQFVLLNSMVLCPHKPLPSHELSSYKYQHKLGFVVRQT